MLGRFIIFTILLSSLLFCYLAVGCDLDGENHGDGPLTPKDQDDSDCPDPGDDDFA